MLEIPGIGSASINTVAGVTMIDLTDVTSSLAGAALYASILAIIGSLFGGGMLMGVVVIFVLGILIGCVLL